MEWHRDALVDRAGQPLDRVGRPVLTEVPFQLSEAEMMLHATIRAVGGAAGATAQGLLIAKMLERTLQSSPAALEAWLRKLVATADADDPIMWLRANEDDEAEGEEKSPVEPSAARVTIALVARALEELDALQGDSKLNSCKALVQQLSATPASRTCVVTDYKATGYYLAEELEATDATCRVLHGGLEAEKQQEAFAQHISDGGVLVGTQALLMSGVDLSHVTDLILYDAPQSESSMRQVLGRFDRFGRVRQLTVYALAPASQTDSGASGGLRVLREVLRSTV